MPDDLWNKVCCVVDNGLFVELAARLARDFGKVLYYAPWKSSFPKMSEAAPGEGIPGVERVYNLFDVVNEVDLFVFPDVYDGDLQVFLRGLGKRVWGSGNAEYLELDRIQSRRDQVDLGVKSPKWEVVKGLEALRARLKQGNDLYVKVPIFRGDFETFHHEKSYTSGPFLDDLAYKYGPQAEQVEFLVEHPVEGDEIGYDGYTVDGQFPATALWGVEVKDRGYVGQVVDYGDLPSPIRDVNALYAPLLRVEQCRSFVSFEMRVAEDGVPYVIDPTMRCGHPPTEAWMELYDNLGEIFWEGSVGNIIDPEPVADFVAMVVIHSAWAAEHWTPIHVPEEIARWVKVRCLCMIDGVRYYVPSRHKMVEIGAVVGFGDSIKEAIETVKHRVERVDGFQLDIRPDVLEGAAEDLEDVSERAGAFTLAASGRGRKVPKLV